MLFITVTPRDYHRPQPSNIMVGPFGEVVVMDWELAMIMPDPIVSAPKAV